jgi:hypothetical protein
VTAVLRVGLGVLAAAALLIGGWNLLLPHVEEATPEVAAVTLVLTVGQPVLALALLGVAAARSRRDGIRRPTMEP